MEKNKFITPALPVQIYFQPYHLMSYIIKKNLSPSFSFPSGDVIENNKKYFEI
jgi:hypothetical protein